MYVYIYTVYMQYCALLVTGVCTCVSVYVCDTVRLVGEYIYERGDWNINNNKKDLRGKFLNDHMDGI